MKIISKHETKFSHKVIEAPIITFNIPYLYFQLIPTHEEYSKVTVEKSAQRQQHDSKWVQ